MQKLIGFYYCLSAKNKTCAKNDADPVFSDPLHSQPGEHRIYFERHLSGVRKNKGIAGQRCLPPMGTIIMQSYKQDELMAKKFCKPGKIKKSDARVSLMENGGLLRSKEFKAGIPTG
jgi:hypothetical protein